MEYDLQCTYKGDLAHNKVKAARGFLSTQRERRARCSERCSSGAAALGQWVTPTAPAEVRQWGPGPGPRAQCPRAVVAEMVGSAPAPRH